MLTDNAITIIVIGGMFAVAFVAWNARWAFESWAASKHSAQGDGDELIVEAIRDATTDLLDALNHANASLDAIRDSNAYLEESERDYNQREGYADEAPGTSLHRLMEQFTSQREAWTQPRKAGRPDGLWLQDDIEPAVDLRKPE